MRILQLVSDWKWTGPAEPMLVLMRALRARGHTVELACPEPPAGANRSLWGEARAWGIEPLGQIEASRRALRPGDRAEIQRIRGWLLGAGARTATGLGADADESDAADENAEGGAKPFDVVHCWHSRDHVLAARALGRTAMGRSGGRDIALIRSLTGAERVRRWPWNRWLLGPACDGLLCVGAGARAANRSLRGGRPIEAVAGAVEAERLEVAAGRAEIRARIGVSNEAPLIGVVARIQPHRRFDLLLAALQRLVRVRPDARLVLIGRGSRVDSLAREPARRMGLEGSVVFAGYRVEDYAAWLRALDVFCYVVPGSDGSCRALLEAATVGLPLVGSRRGAIPEIIRDGVTGCLVDEDPEELAATWAALLADAPRRRALGEAAARDARMRFAPARLAESVEGFYAVVRAGLGQTQARRRDSSCTPISSR